MKKNMFWVPIDPNLRKFLLTMKLCLLFLVISTATLMANSGYSQSTTLSLHLKNATLREFIEEVESKTEFIFVSYDGVVGLDKVINININVKDQKIDKILDEVFESTDKTYRIYDRQIAIGKKDPITNEIITSEAINLSPFPAVKKLTGVVSEENGSPIPFATVFVKGTTLGTNTDLDGKFSLSIPDNSKILLISCVGFQTQEIAIGEKTVINIILKGTSIELSDLVVIGYGSQKKINLTGSLSTVDPVQLINSGVSNISSSLVGNASGITGLQVTGEPGRDGTSIYIRGRSTLNSGGSNPLIVIDGIEQASEQAFSQLNNMDPNEIGSVSILKDAASTAVFGIRGANGVIVISTKRGNTGKPKIRFSTSFGFTAPTNLMKTANSYEWADMRNTAIKVNRDQLGDPSFNDYLFTEDQLWKFKNGRDYTPAEVDAMTNLTDAQKATLKQSPAIWYGSTDFVDKIFNHKGPMTTNNLSVSGGGEKIKYYTSIGYMYQGSIIGNSTFAGSNTGSTFNRYNYRTNIDFFPTKNLDISISMAGQFGTTSGFAGGTSVTDNNARYKIIYQYIQEGNPYLLPGIIDGHLTNIWAGAGGSARNPLGTMTPQPYSPVYILLKSGQGILKNTLISNILKVTHRLDYLTDGLSIRGTLSYDNNYTKITTISPTMAYYDVTRDMNDPNNLLFFGGRKGSTSFNNNASSDSWNKTYVDVGIDYAKTIGEHKLTLLALGKASIYKLPTAGGYYTPSGIMGLVGRATYNYKQRYMGEFSMGYNGTEQFAEGRRFGFFPSFSAGWILSEEKFFSKPNWLDFLKIRGSFGKVGSDFLNSRRYLYLPSSYNQNQSGYYLGNSDGSQPNPQYKGTAEGTIGNPDVTWEKSTKRGIGLETKYLGGRLSFNFDLFNENRTNILISSNLISFTYGVPSGSIPPSNLGETENKGYELNMEWKDHIKDFGYSFSGSLSYAHNKIVYQAEVPNPYSWQNVTGLPIGQYRGLVSDGFFNTPEELANRPYFSYTSNKQVLGDIRYRDVNSDGIINEKDMVPIGYSNLPQYSYNFRINLNYKGFDFSVMFNGSRNGSYYLNQGYTTMFAKNQGNVYKWQCDGVWTPEKAASGADIFYPRPNIDASVAGNFVTSDFWLKSTNFVKLKNIQIGYTVPVDLLKKAGISNSSLRLYFDGNNVFTFKNALNRYGIDPEMTDTGSNALFPLTKIFLWGLDFTF